MKNVIVISFAQIEFQSVFRALSQKFKILNIPNVFAHGTSYEHGFLKKHDGLKLCTKSRTKSSFDWFFVHHLKKFKILAIPNVLAHGKSYEHGFMKNATVINFAQSQA
ncbi:hypothetical protein GW17_00041598 [Ensete ventricosum]|nr:hypothetical protein GW17_00041598 [Ensete ventricosum]